MTLLRKLGFLGLDDEDRRLIRVCIRARMVRLRTASPFVAAADRANIQEELDELSSLLARFQDGMNG